jgi:hypothetical protein
MNLYRSSGSKTGLKTLFGICALVSVLGGLAAHADEGDDEFQIRTLSTRADMVSGSDVLVQIDVPSRVRLTDVRVDLVALLAPSQRSWGWSKGWLWDTIL